MNRQQVGKVLFWLGVISLFVWQALTWFQNPVQRVHTAGELSGTAYAVWGTVWWIRLAGGSLGLALPIVGVLLQASGKGFSWFLGLVPSAALGVGMNSGPFQHLPQVFGLGGAVIVVSYLGILWLWTRTYASYKGLARTGRQVQLLGYSFLFGVAMLLCSYVGDPHVLALVGQPSASAEAVNISLALGMLLLFLGHYLVARDLRQATTGRQPDPGKQTAPLVATKA